MHTRPSGGARASFVWPSAHRAKFQHSRKRQKPAWYRPFRSLTPQNHPHDSPKTHFKNTPDGRGRLLLPETIDTVSQKYDLVRQVTGDGGFSATVFREKVTGKSIIAYRGTDSGGDFANYVDTLNTFVFTNGTWQDNQLARNCSPQVTADGAIG